VSNGSCCTFTGSAAWVAGTGAAVSTVSKSDPAKPSCGFGSVVPPTCCTGVSAMPKSSGFGGCCSHKRFSRSFDQAPKSARSSPVGSPAGVAAESGNACPGLFSIRVI
ncbi:hypothetical protein KSY13_26155, partial [Bacteroides sp. MSK.17.76]|nr:hypothetical protein [Bacteroides sp. MSK.17.76]